MKKLNKLKINEIAKDNLSHKEMRYVVGGTGGGCTCSCYWEDQGGSGVYDNCAANTKYSYTSTHGDPVTGNCLDPAIINP